MTQEEKDLLLKDLCARLPYGVICDRLGKPKKLLGVYPTKKFPLEFDNGEYMPSNYMLEDIKPYLRPMSSMTEEEKAEYWYIKCPKYDDNGYIIDTYGEIIDWLNKNKFDYRGLIPIGLALEAPEGMYKFE